MHRNILIFILMVAAFAASQHQAKAHTKILIKKVCHDKWVPRMRYVGNQLVQIVGGSASIDADGYGCQGEYKIVLRYRNEDCSEYDPIRPGVASENDFTVACEAAGGEVRYGFIFDPNDRAREAQVILCSKKLNSKYSRNQCIIW